MGIFSTLPKITFEIIENDPIFYEGPTFKREIVDKLGEDKLVFFAHIKGVTNVKNEDPETVYRRICGLYYFSLEEEKSEGKLTRIFLKDVYTISHGAFMTRFISEYNFHNKYAWYYAGTFFWINTRRLKNYIKDNNIELPEYADRYYDENFLGDIYPIFGIEELKSDMIASSYKYKYVSNPSPNRIDFEWHLNFLIEGEEEKFNNFVKDMKKV